MRDTAIGVTVTACILAVLIMFSVMSDDNKEAFIKDCKEAGGIPVTTSRANVCLSVNAIIKLEE